MDFEAFLIDVLTPILDNPEALRVEVKGEGRKADVLIYADPKDRGRIIGKSGRTITAIRTLLINAAAKNSKRVMLEIIEPEGGRPRSPAPDAPVNL